MAAKREVFNDRKNRYEEINWSRNGYITQHITSLDFEEIVRVGGVKIEIFDGFFCNKLDFNPFQKFILDMTVKRNKYKKEKKTL